MGCSAFCRQQRALKFHFKCKYSAAEKVLNCFTSIRHISQRKSENRVIKHCRQVQVFHECAKVPSIFFALFTACLCHSIRWGGFNSILLYYYIKQWVTMCFYSKPGSDCFLIDFELHFDRGVEWRRTNCDKRMWQKSNMWCISEKYHHTLCPYCLFSLPEE